MLMLDAELGSIYEQACRAALTEHTLGQMHAFLELLFDRMQPAGFINEHDEMAFDAFMLSGDKIDPVFRRPTFEKK